MHVPHSLTPSIHHRRRRTRTCRRRFACARASPRAQPPGALAERLSPGRFGRRGVAPDRRTPARHLRHQYHCREQAGWRRPHRARTGAHRRCGRHNHGPDADCDADDFPARVQETRLRHLSRLHRRGQRSDLRNSHHRRARPAGQYQNGAGMADLGETESCQRRLWLARLRHLATFCRHHAGTHQQPQPQPHPVQGRGANGAKTCWAARFRSAWCR